VRHPARDGALRTARESGEREVAVGRVTRDGVSLAYVEAGAGDPPIVLVHGWGGTKEVFRPQIEHFSKGHRAVALDLRGMGESDTPESGFTIEGFADDVLFLCSELGVEKPVLVGQSMGGVVVTLLAAKHPQFPRAVVMLDSAVVPTEACLNAFASGVEPLKGSEYEAFVRSFVPALFAPVDDPELKASIVDDLMNTPQRVLSESWEDTLATDSAAAAARLSMPVLYVGGALGFLNDLVKLQELVPHLMVGQTMGSGHYHTREVPDQVNAMINRFLSLVVEKPELVSKGA
jgi:pimeloyl-ACP methyl ester carboxylesterase